MGKIDISFELVREKTNGLKTTLQTKLGEGIIKRYENLDSSLQQSGGEGIEMIKEGLQQEKGTLADINLAMNALLDFVQESADAFEDVDISHDEILKKFV